jgi:hypothetical protein
MSVIIKGISKFKNVIISNGAAVPPATTALWTVFGDQSGSVLPTIDGTGVTDFYVKSYIAGIFAVTADLANLNISDVRAGVRYTGGAAGGVIEVILGGTVVQTAAVTGPAVNVGGTLDTTYGQWPSSYLGSNAGFIGYLEIYAGSEFIFIESNVPNTVLTFDTKNVKFAWYVDTNTGLTPGTLLDGYPIYSSPATMYTSVTPQSTFDWQQVLQVQEPDGSFLNTMYNAPTSTALNINLGGYSPSWTDVSGVSNTNNYGVFYDLNYPATPSNSLSVDGGWYYTQLDPGDIETNGTMIFPVTTPVASNYVQLDKANTGAAVETAGIRSYLAIASSVFGGYIQSVNYGLPVLYEQWYSSGNFVAPPPTAAPVEWIGIPNTNITNWNPNLGTQFNSIIWTGTEFLTIGTGSIPNDTTYFSTLTSSDGITWEGKVYNVEMLPGFWKSVCIGNGTYVAVGRNDDVLTSDGSQDVNGDLIWTQTINSIAPMVMNSVCFGDNKFVAVGGSSNGNSAFNIMVNIGAGWTGVETASDIVFNTICYSSVLGKFVAGGTKFDGSGALYTSTDATTWIAQTSVLTECTSLTATNTGVMGVGVVGNNPAAVWTTDGTAWQSNSTPNVGTAGSCCYASAPDVVIATTGNGGAQVTQTGEIWTASTVVPASGGNWRSVCYSPTLNMCASVFGNFPDVIMIAPLSNYTP